MIRSSSTREEAAWKRAAIYWQGENIGIAEARGKYKEFVASGGKLTFIQWVEGWNYNIVFNEKEDDVEYPDKVLIEAGSELRGFKRYKVKAEGFFYQVPPDRVAEAIERGGKYRVAK